MGRAARNVDGQVIMYADTVTDSMTKAISITQERRARQQAYNAEHGIDPSTVRKAVTDILERIRPAGSDGSKGRKVKGGRGRSSSGPGRAGPRRWAGSRDGSLHAEGAPQIILGRIFSLPVSQT